MRGDDVDRRGVPVGGVRAQQPARDLHLGEAVGGPAAYRGGPGQAGVQFGAGTAADQAGELVEPAGRGDRSLHQAGLGERE